MTATAPTLETTEARGQFMKWAIDRQIAVEDPKNPGFYTLPEGVRLYPDWLPENEAEADIGKYRAYLEGVKLDLAQTQNPLALPPTAYGSINDQLALFTKRMQTARSQERTPTDPEAIDILCQALRYLGATDLLREYSSLMIVSLKNS